MRVAITIGQVTLFALDLQWFAVEDPKPPIRITLEHSDDDGPTTSEGGSDDDRIL